jgi:hypothetical protein
LNWIKNYIPPPETTVPDAWSGMLGSTSLQRLETGYSTLAPGASMDQFINAQKQEFVFDSNNRVLVNVRSSSPDHIDQMKSDLVNNLGMTVTTVTPSQNMVTGFLPISAVENIPSVTDYSAVTPVYAPIVSAGSVTSAGDQVIKADAFRTHYGLDGTGVTVGVISDSVNQLDSQGNYNPGQGIAEAQQTGDLPASGVNVLQDGTGNVTDEGRAMLEVIHDVAPGSPLAFSTGEGGPQNFAQGIRNLATQAGAQVIVDDVSYPNEPFFSSGVLTQAVNDVYNHQNVTYVTAAGNNADQAWTAPFSPISAQVADTPYTTFANVNPGGGQGQVLQHFSLQPGQTLDLSFQWDAAFLEGGSPLPVYQVPNEMDVLVTDANGSHVLAKFNDNTRNTDEALQRVVFTNDGSFGTNDFALAFPLAGGPAPRQLKWVRFDKNAPAELQGAPSIFGHAGAQQALTVAAAPASNPVQAEPFSSVGNVAQMFDYAGHPTARQQIIPKPDITGPDAVQVASWAGTSGTASRLPGSLPVFAGTSAAAAHVAGAAALQLSQHPGLYPLLVDQILKETAQPLGQGPHDTHTGAGLVQVIDPNVTPKVGPVVNASQETGNQSEVSVAVDPNNPNNVALGANENDLGGGMGFYFSTDGGQTFKKRVIADGSDGLNQGFSDPALAWDTFGNLYYAYLDNNTSIDDIAISTDAGATFKNLAQITSPTGNTLDQPSITTGPDAGGSGQTVWLDAADVGSSMPMVVAGAHVTGSGAAGVSAFTIFTIPFTANFATNFSDISVGPNGEVATDYTDFTSINPDGPGTIEISVNPLGLGGTFPAPVAATVIQTGTFSPGFLPNMPDRTPGTETKGAISWDRSNGPHRGRLYAVVEDSAATDDPATKVFVLFSDDMGKTWSPRVQVNDDTTSNSHNFPRLAVDSTTGNVITAWYDARNDLGQGGPGDLDGKPNTDLEIYGALSTDGGATWAPNFQVSQNASSAILNGGNSSNDYGDYIGLVFHNGMAHIGWTDNSKDIAATNPDSPNFDIATDTIMIPSSSSNGIPNGGGVVSVGDIYEPNSSSDHAALLGLIGGPFNTAKQYLQLDILNHANGLPDYDWYRWAANAAGTFTATIAPGSSSGPLEIHLFTVNASGTLVELAQSNQPVQGLITVSTHAVRDEPLYVEVKGMEMLPDQFGQGTYDMAVRLV